MIKLQLCNDYEQITEYAAKCVLGVLAAKPDCVLGLATGSSPVGLYREMCRANEEGCVDFSRVQTFNLDEYYPMRPDHPQSYHYFMEEHLFGKVNLKRQNIHIPDGVSDDPEKTCLAYEAAYDASGGADIQVLGIGRNGHIGFNEPAEHLCEITHLTDLTKSTIEANARFFEREEDVPKKAITMGIGTILKARRIIVLASGPAKTAALRKMMEGPVTDMCPASRLQEHPDVTLICDRAAWGV